MWLAAIALGVGVSSAQEEGSPGPSEEAPASPAVESASPEGGGPTVASIDERIAALEGAESVEPAVRERAVGLLREARGELERASALSGQELELEAAASEAPALMESIRQEMSQPAPEPTISPPADATIAQLEQSLEEAKAQLELAERRRSELEGERTRRDERRSAIPGRIAQARDELEAARASLAGLARGEGEAEAVYEARGTRLRARERALSQELDTLEAELASYDARQKLLPLRADRAARRVATAERLVELWQSEVSRRRQIEAKAAEREAERAAARAAMRHPVLEEFANESKGLAAKRVGPDGLVQRLDRSEALIAKQRAELRRLRDGFESLARRLEVSGLSRATGLMLRREYEALPQEADLRIQLRGLGDRLDDAEFQLLDLQDRREEEGAIDRAHEQLMQRIEGAGGVTESNRERLAVAARELVVARRDLLDELVSDSRALLERLVELEETTRTLLRATRAYAAFVEERILWVRSVPTDLVGGPEEFVRGYRWLTDGESWSRAVGAIWRYARDRWARVGLVVVSVGVLLGVAPRVRRRLRELGERSSSYRTDRYWYSVEALLLTVVLALRLPALAWLAGWLLSLQADRADAVSAMAQSLWSVAPVLAPLEFLRVATAPGGLAESHLRWPKQSARGLRRHLSWFVPLAFPLAVLMRTTTYAPTEPVQATLGRVLFTGVGVVTSVAVYAILRPRGRVLRDWLRSNPSNLVTRLRMVWFGALVATPMVLVVVAWMGFFYTATRLGRQYGLTIALGVVLVVAQGLMLRWLFIQRRRVAIEAARRRREQAAAEASEASEGDEGVEASASAAASAVASGETHTVDLPAMSAQTKQLFTTGVWVTALLGLFAVWADVLPALRMLDRVQVWPSIRVVEPVDTEAPRLLMGRAPAAAQRGAGSAEAAGVDGPGEAAVEGAGANGLFPGGGLPTLVQAPVGAGGGAVDEAEGLEITLADLGVFAIALLATWAVFRNLPGLIEITILPRLPLDAGARYALTTVMRYVIAIVGVTMAFAVLGVTWTSLQWLAAALTFGLAFGLQEIFANFVSGLIILWERPYRVGDVVTVGQVSGKVTRIRMRATTIQDWDRKELVIPNKTFITGDVINWTLTDSILRLVIPVGVSYGADVRLAERALLEVARAHPNVLEDPAPRAFFLGFGDSALAFDIRVYIPNLDNLLGTKHDLHMMIIEKFRELGIEIAFPQRDLHIRSIGELREALVPRESAREGEGAASSA